jgi:hypothetical protein
MSRNIGLPFLLSMATILATFSSIGQTRDPNRVEASPQVPENAKTKFVYLLNNNKVKLYYSVSYNSTDWRNDSISPNTIRTYPMANTFYIKVVTLVNGGRDSVFYYLNQGSYNSIELNPNTQKWDVYIIKKNN